MQEVDIQYDKFGRMLYNPEFHRKDFTRWNEEDTKYLIEWYGIIGSEEMSFALDRTMPSIQHKVSKLRKEGKMNYGRSRYVKKELGVQKRREYTSI